MLNGIRASGKSGQLITILCWVWVFRVFVCGVRSVCIRFANPFVGGCFCINNVCYTMNTHGAFFCNDMRECVVSRVRCERQLDLFLMFNNMRGSDLHTVCTYVRTYNIRLSVHE